MPWEPTTILQRGLWSPQTQPKVGPCTEFRRCTFSGSLGHYSRGRRASGSCSRPLWRVAPQRELLRVTSEGECRAPPIRLSVMISEAYWRLMRRSNCISWRQISSFTGEVVWRGAERHDTFFAFDVMNVWYRFVKERYDARAINFDTSPRVEISGFDCLRV